jgi:guanylate kinase
MKRPLALLCAASSLFTSCSTNEELQDRMDKRNDTYRNLQERMEIRQDAREERDQARWDRMMN